MRVRVCVCVCMFLLVLDEGAGVGWGVGGSCVYSIIGRCFNCVYIYFFFNLSFYCRMEAIFFWFADFHATVFCH